MKRPRQHVMETESEQLLLEFLPSEWIVRQVPKDYGVDYEVELVDRSEVSGKRIWIQLKSVDKDLKIRKRFNDLTEQEEAYISYSLSTDFLDYATKCPFPLLLFLADLSHGEIYWLPLQAAITYSLAKRKPEWHSQYSTTVRIPIKNRLSIEKDNDYPGLRWYALELNRVYALMRLNELYGAVEPNITYGFRFSDNWIDPYEEMLMRETVRVLKYLVEQALNVDVLFGEEGVDYYNQLVLQLEESSQSANRVLDLLDQRQFSFRELSMSITKALFGANTLKHVSTFYFALNQRFILWEYPSRT